MTPTDQAFEDEKPGYYIFSSHADKSCCYNCDKTFKSALELNRFCKPECKRGFLKIFTG